MTYLVLVRHGESIWHALWTKEPVLLWSISADGCCGPRARRVPPVRALWASWPWSLARAVGRVPAWPGAAGVVVAAIAVMILAGLVIPVVPPARASPRRHRPHHRGLGRDGQRERCRSRHSLSSAALRTIPSGPCWREFSAPPRPRGFQRLAH